MQYHSVTDRQTDKQTDKRMDLSKLKRTRDEFMLTHVEINDSVLVTRKI